MLFFTFLLGIPFPWTAPQATVLKSHPKRSGVSRMSALQNEEGLAADYAGIFAQSAGISKAWAWPSGDCETIMLQRSARDVNGNKARSFVQAYELKGEEWRQASPFPLELRDAVIFCPSPSGKLLAIVREAPGERKDAQAKDYIIEIWANNQREGSLVDQISTVGLHEKIIAGSWFGELAWSSDETKLVYVAQKKAPKTRPFFAKEPAKADDSACRPGDNFLYDQDWGEKYEGVSRLGLFVVDLSGTGRVEEIDGVPDDLTPGQPCFSKDGKHVVYVGWDCKPRKLGMIYCYQRPCTLYSVPVGMMLVRMEEQATDAPNSKDTTCEASKERVEEHQCLCPSWKLARSPRFSPTGDRLVWLSRQEGFDTHNGCFRLTSAPWNAQSGTLDAAPRTVVDIVTSPESPGGFPGLWVDGLPDNCWSADGSSIFLSSAWGSRQSVLKVDVETGKVDRVVCATEVAGQDPETGKPEDVSASVLTVGRSGVFVTASSPNSPGGFGVVVHGTDSWLKTVVGTRVGGASIAPYPRVRRARVEALREAVTGIQWRILSVPPLVTSEGQDAEQPFEAILLMPPSKRGTSPSPIPLVVAPHGGPHGVMPTAFIPAFAYLAVTQGVGVLHVNFRGSTGFGTASLESLPSRIGTQDVGDVVAATKLALASEPKALDPARVGVMGGSHGGFLAAHLSAQHPDIFKVAVLRNPVTNVAGMVTPGDIPDWCYIETLGLGNYVWESFSPPSAEDLHRMWSVSPVRHVKGVRAPTLIALGGNDRRVPPSQGLEWYHTLKSAGVETRLLMYPEDVHAIDKPASEADQWLNIAIWFKEHLV